MLGFRRARKPAPGGAGPKGSERIALCERCEFEVAGSGNPREGTAWNVSVAGLYLVVTDDIPPADAAISVCLWLPGDLSPVRAETRVVWCNPRSHFRGCGANALRFPPGCGLRFVVLSDEDRARIQSRVDSVQPYR